MKENQPIEIIYQDEHLVAVNKPSGMLAQTDNLDNSGLLSLLQQQLSCKLWGVNRIDRPVSGLVLFARNKRALVAMNEKFSRNQVVKKYWAVVQQKPAETKKTLVHYIRKNEKDNRSFAFDKPLHHTKKAELTYFVLGSITNYHLLDVELHTGRHHQIRAQLAAVGSPIKGDVKYGFRRGNRDRSIHLHAFLLKFKHPLTNEPLAIEVGPPKESVWDAFGIVPPYDF